MNQFRKRATGELFSEAGVRNSLPEVGLPAVLDVATLDAYGFDPILNAPQPQTVYGKMVVGTDPVQDANGNWVTGWALNDIDADTFAIIKAADQQRVWEAIKAERDRRKAGGLKLTVDGNDYWFWTDDPSRGQYAMLTDMVRRKGLPGSYKLDDWKTMSGAYVAFTVDLLYGVIDGGIANESALFRTAEAKRQAMRAADDPNTFNWNIGWPQTYEEYQAEIDAAAAAAINADVPKETTE